MGRHLLCRNASGFYVVGCTDIKQDLPVGDKRVYYIISSPQEIRMLPPRRAAAETVTVPARFFQKSLSDGRIIVAGCSAQEMKYISIYSSLWLSLHIHGCCAFVAVFILHSRARMHKFVGNIQR